MGQLSQVDTPGLALVGAAVTRTAPAFARACTVRSAELTADGALGGWATGPALDGTTGAWTAYLKQLTTDLDRTGAALARSAADFREADRLAGDRITVAGHSPVAVS